MSRERSVVVQVVVLWMVMVLAPACKPPPPAVEKAAEVLLVAVVPEVEAMATAAERAGEGYQGTPLVQELADKAARARAVVAGAEEGWQLQALAVLREALVTYERLRELGMPLPRPPILVVELLTPCKRPE